MNGLKPPLQFTGHRIYGDERVSEQIVTLPVYAVIIVIRRTEGHVENSALDVRTKEGPHIDARLAFPLITLPSIVAGLTRARNGMSRPVCPCGRPMHAHRRPGPSLRSRRRCGRP